MLVILSPAKNMRHCTWDEIPVHKPQFQQQTEILAEHLRQYSHFELESLMQINPKLALQAYCYYQEFVCNYVGLPSLLAYDGLVFKHIRAETFSLEQYLYADEHVRILSAFYGLLRPCDGIMPYRLEMTCKLNIDGQTLYQYWGDLVYRQLFSSNQPVINLASVEYSKMVMPWLQSHNHMITIDFRTMCQGKLRTITTSAKMARGEMTSWIVRNQIEKPEELQWFCWDDYQFEQRMSTATTYVFVQQKIDKDLI